MTNRMTIIRKTARIRNGKKRTEMQVGGMHAPAQTSFDSASNADGTSNVNQTLQTQIRPENQLASCPFNVTIRHMRIEEQDQIFGRLSRQTRECKSRVVALERKLMDYAILFDRTAASLRLRCPPPGQSWLGDHRGQRNDFDAANWPLASDVESTLTELDNERQQLTAFEQQLSSIQ